MNEGMIRVSIAAAVFAAGCSGSGPGDCVGDSCMPSTCTNGVKDAFETDVDCGGPDCIKCSGKRACQISTDCFSGDCDPSTNTCFALTVSFAQAVMYDSMLKPYVLLSSDVDGDGDLDLVVANEENSMVAVFRNDGSGAFTRLPESPTEGFHTGEYPTGGAIADFNRDGVPDVITANFHGDSVSILLGTGTRDAYTLSASSSYPTTAGGETSNLAVGDLNRDGIPDVIATNPMASSMSVFLGRNDGTLAPAIQVALAVPGWGEPSQPYSATIADFDGDGINDAAIADNGTAKVLIELGTGDGMFTAAAQPTITMNGYSYIIVADDMTLDGNVDLVIADRNGDEVCVMRGHGDATFDDAVCSTTGAGTGPYSVAVADFNLDGVPDVVTANFMTGTASVLLGIGDGRFESPIDAGAMGDNSYGVVAGDFNHDGKPDIATANASANTVAVKMSTAH